MKLTTRALALTAVAALLATACGQAPDEGTEAEGTATGTGTAEAVDFTACMVTDEGGPDDGSFNETAYNGMLRAEEQLGIETKVLQSESEADYAPNIDTFIQDDCDIIVPVGFALDAATQAAAKDNPEQLFAIVDVDMFDFAKNEDVTLDNVRELTFKTDEAAFQAGYAAAAFSESGKIGTYGGRPFPTVTIFMDGFLAGASYHNQEKGTNVEVLGWTGDPDKGLFTGDFSDTNKGRQVTEQLLANGADIVLPVAGPVGQGTVAAIQDAGKGSVVWVDTDGYLSVPGAESVMFTSIMKNMDVAVFESIELALNDEWEGGLYVGTLENNGVQIAPFHDFEAKLPDGLLEELDQIEQGIIAGDISVAPADYAG